MIWTRRVSFGESGRCLLIFQAPGRISGRVYGEGFIEYRQQSFGRVLSGQEGAETEKGRASVQAKKNRRRPIHYRNSPWRI